MDKNNKFLKKNVSFARRVGRKFSPNQQDLFEDYLRFSNIQSCYKRAYKTVIEDIKSKKPQNISLEIGFGNGDHLFNLAKQNPDSYFIGCEPYLNGVVSLLAKIKEFNLQNIFIWADDANLLIEQLQEQFIDKCYILFPDPWPKKKHRKRRIISKEFLDRIAPKISNKGFLIVATDHCEYAKHVMNIMLLRNDFKILFEDISTWTTFPSSWQKTKYHQKSMDQDLTAFYFTFTKHVNDQDYPLK